MIWKNIDSEESIVLPKPMLWVISSVILISSYVCIDFMLKVPSLKDRIGVGITALLLILIAIPNIELIFMGDRYVKSIEKKEDYFILINVFKKKTLFNRAQIESIKLWDSSKMNLYFGQLKGLDLLLKNGLKFRITSEMENFESLKKHLLGIEEKDKN